MVECEYDIINFKDGEIKRFNRYMVECEYIKRTNTRTGSETF